MTGYFSSVQMPTLAISQTPSLQYVAAYGIGAILVFEYLYFLLQANKVNGGLQANLEQAVRTYQTSGVQATVAKLITAAFQHHGEDVEVLTPILVGIAKENQIKDDIGGDIFQVVTGPAATNADPLESFTVGGACKICSCLCPCNWMCHQSSC
ncbi:hypothetical protein BKA82DRAFT_778709 [Pisolithus tinctorius]|uniref:Uncharacterized protein n=1 Tax=Pisolithus tinctorius Marx 270 TaxID=870435 RepID=A0A0C3NXA0_PISTI|nr:hypothetical protein BKA82DRAFT_778709 [Pisolithus tinctorius]KIN99803.1 hypothetical protein M404DRAFT_778709 [Pisolithus tinctorius Marx 270]